MDIKSSKQIQISFNFSSTMFVFISTLEYKPTVAMKYLVIKSYRCQFSWSKSDSVASFIGVMGGWSPASAPFLEHK